MKISCKFGEPSWRSSPLRGLTLKISLPAAVAAKPKYPPDASGGYNNQHEPVSYTANNKGDIWTHSLI